MVTAVLLACPDNVIVDEPIPVASEYVVEEPEPKGFERAEPNMTIEEWTEENNGNADVSSNSSPSVNAGDTGGAGDSGTGNSENNEQGGGVPWEAIARCESGYGGEPNWSINTGNGFYGGLQFEKESWDWAGGQQYAEWPHHATREQQIAVAEQLLSIHPAGIGAWPACADKLGLR